MPMAKFFKTKRLIAFLWMFVSKANNLFVLCVISKLLGVALLCFWTYIGKCS